MGTKGQRKRSGRNGRLLNKRREGCTYSDLARNLGISRQRVQQILSPPPEIRRYILNKYNEHCLDCDKYTGTSGHVHHKDLNKNGGNFHDIDNLVLLCRSCHRKRHRLPQKTISLVCSFCKKSYERVLTFQVRRALNRNKSGLHFCSKVCQGKWVATNYGFKKGDNRKKSRKYDYDQVYRLRERGLSGIKISRELDIPEASVYRILRLMPKE